MRRIPHDEAPAHYATPGAAVPTEEVDEATGAASGAGGGEESESGVGPGGVLAAAATFADPGTRWSPTPEEQVAMTRVMAYLLGGARLS